MISIESVNNLNGSRNHSWNKIRILRDTNEESKQTENINILS